MKTYGLTLILLTALAGGCALLCPPPPAPPPISRDYHAAGFDWSAVGRMLILPLANETAYYPAAEEFRDALAAELQALGRFEVVRAPCDAPGCLVQDVRLGGRFNEAALIELARVFRAEVIVLGTITQYSPYPPPRLGLSVQAVSPFDAVVVASADGLWDAASKGTADLAQAFHREGLRPRQAWMTSELTLDSPRFFQRFVGGQVARALTGW